MRPSFLDDVSAARAAQVQAYRRARVVINVDDDLDDDPDADEDPDEDDDSDDEDDEDGDEDEDVETWQVSNCHALP